MPDPARSLGGARFDGIAAVCELPPMGMLAIRADLAKAGEAIAEVLGVPMPAPLCFKAVEGRGLGWMSPDELLATCGYDEAPTLAGTLRDALGNHHALVAVVSDMRASFAVEGAGMRDVLAKLAPADLTPGAAGPGAFRRTRLAQIPAAIAISAEGAVVHCFRSHARYAFDVLRAAAAGPRLHALGDALRTWPARP